MTDPFMTDDSLDKLFAQARSSEPYFDDDGFTARVMGELKPTAAVPVWQEYLISLLFTLLGAGLALFFFPVDAGISFLVSALNSNPVLLSMMTGLLILLLGGLKLKDEYLN